MKTKTLPTKRTPVTKGVFRKLSAVTQGRRRKQRAATTASARDFDDGEGSTRIGRALVVILLIHVLAVAMIFVHHQFLSDRPAEQAANPAPDAKVIEPKQAVAPSQGSGVVHSQLSPGQKRYVALQGETYASIAADHQISEQDLRSINNNVEVRSGRFLTIPVKRVVIRTPQQQAAQQAVNVQVQAPVARAEPVAVPVRDQGLVSAVDTRDAPRAQAVTTNGKYVVRKGDTVWGIANRHGVKPDALKAANGITDPRKLRVGMTLKIP